MQNFKRFEMLFGEIPNMEIPNSKPAGAF